MLTEHIPLPEDTNFDLRDLYTNRTVDGRWEVRLQARHMGVQMGYSEILGYLGGSGWEVEAALEELRTRIRVHRALSSC